jgi:drug/metabolite transporter (DMT)-like permease
MFNYYKEMKLLTLYLIILVLSWTISPFIKKMVSQKMGIDEYLLVSTTVFFIFIWLYYLYRYIFLKKALNFSVLKNFKIDDYAFLLFVVLNSVLSVIIFIKLINMTEVSYLIPQVQCIIIALTFIIGYIIFNESFSIKKGLGIFFIILGILFVNMKTKK